MRCGTLFLEAFSRPAQKCSRVAPFFCSQASFSLNAPSKAFAGTSPDLRCSQPPKKINSRASGSKIPRGRNFLLPTLKISSHNPACPNLNIRYFLWLGLGASQFSVPERSCTKKSKAARAVLSNEPYNRRSGCDDPRLYNPRTSNKSCYACPASYAILHCFKVPSDMQYYMTSQSLEEAASSVRRSPRRCCRRVPTR